MIRPFKDDYPLSQEWGKNPQIYKRFGLKGHNGVDWALPTGTEIIAPHSGKILEAAYDKNGYGRYIKIENDKWGSILAHLKKIDVSVGDEIQEGGYLALSNNTGFSTGSHLHWGLYPKPRNKGNGYSGTVDPFKGDIMSQDNTYKGLDLSNKDSMRVAVDVWHDVTQSKKYVTAEEYQKLKDSSKTRIEQEEKRYKDFLEDLSKKLGIAPEEPKLLENISELLAAKEPTSKVEVIEGGHSKICRMLARIGL